MINVIRMLTIDEGLRDTAYKDTAGKTTVGIGFNMDDVNSKILWQYAGVAENFDLVKNKTMLLSKESAWKLANLCIDNAEIDLRHVFDNYDDLPEGVKLGLINLMYNMGATVFAQFKQFIALVKAGDYDGASADIGNTKWATQVGTRKQRVMGLFLGQDSGYN